MSSPHSRPTKHLKVAASNAYERKKSQLRDEYRQRRRNISNRQSLEKLIVENLFKTLNFEDCKSIGFYLSIDGEVNPMALLEKLNGKITALPHISERKEMSFKPWKKGDILTQHRTLKVSQPTEEKTIIPELIFVPLIAFNQDCHRLGFGKGFFDRFILNSRLQNHNILYIGLAYDEQFCASLIVEKHDQPLDLIVTQTRVLKKAISHIFLKREKS